MDLFFTYQWPGNIRELEHLIEGAMNMAGQEKLLGIDQFTPGLDTLEPVETTAGHPPAPRIRDLPDMHDNPSSLTAFQTEHEKTAVDAALAAARGNVTRAAKSLGISRQLLHYKIKKYRLCRADYMPRP